MLGGIDSILHIVPLDTKLPTPEKFPYLRKAKLSDTIYYIQDIFIWRNVKKKNREPRPLQSDG